MGRDETVDLLEVIELRLHSRLRRASYSSVCLSLFCVALFGIRAFEIEVPFVKYADAAQIAVLVGLMGALAVRFTAVARIRRLESFEMEVIDTAKLRESFELQSCLDDLEERAARRSDYAAVLAKHWHQLVSRLEALLDSEARQRRAARIAQLCEEADLLVKDAIRQRHENDPHVRAKLELERALVYLRELVSEADRQFEAALEKKFLKAWSIISRPGRKQLRMVRQEIKALEAALASVSANPELIKAERDYEHLVRLVDQRLSAAKSLASEAIPLGHRDSFEPDHALSLGLVSAAFSVPVSLAMDLGQAGSVYDALRDVNGNYVGMTDFEIWHETLTMSPDALAGLAALTKGSYFETLVEGDLGGERFAEFNHPDTDILIDGVAYQIKATDSVAYVEGVAEHIPVIATTEVAELTGSIDGGYSNIDLSEAVDLALGGSVIDIGDTLLDGITTGIGGVGVVAIIQGTHAAWSKYRSDGDAVSALGVGVTKTAAGVARTIVNATELIYRGGQAATKAVTRMAASNDKPNHLRKNSKTKSTSPSECSTPFDAPSDKVIRLSTKPVRS